MLLDFWAKLKFITSKQGVIYLVQMNKLELNLDFFFCSEEILNNNDMLDDKKGFKNYDIMIKNDNK